MLISFTSLSQWHEAPAILNPTLGPVFTAGNKLGYSATEVVEYNSNSDNDHMVTFSPRSLLCLNLTLLFVCPIRNFQNFFSIVLEF